MKSSIAAAAAATLTSLLCACTSHEPPAEAPRPVRTVELRYSSALDVNRYFGTVASRYEVEQAFRVGGKVRERRVDVGQSVRAGAVLAVLDDADFRLAEEAARQRLDAAKAHARQAESDWKRLQALETDGSVSATDEEHAQSNLLTTRAAAKAEGRQLELTSNQVQYTVLRAPIAGVVTSLSFEAGQVVAPGQPVIAIANEGEPEILVDVPEDQLEAFKTAHYQASLASIPNEVFDVELRELSAQASRQTRTYRARLKPAVPRHLPLGATATLIAQRMATGSPVAVIPASAITQHKGEPAIWAVHTDSAGATGTVELIRVAIHGYRNDEVLVSGPAEGARIVTAGVQKMAPGLRVALPATAPSVTVSQVVP